MLHRQNRAGSVTPVNSRYVEILIIFEVGGKAFDIAPFGEHVQFAEYVSFEFFHQIDGTDDPADVKSAFDLFGKIVHQLNVFPYRLLDSGPDDFDGHTLAALQLGMVNLGDGSRCERFSGEFEETVLNRPAELAFDHGPDIFESNSGNPILEFFQFRNIIGWKEVGARAHQLPQLNEAGAEVFENPPQPGRRQVKGIGFGKSERRGSAADYCTVQDIAESVFRKNPRYPCEPSKPSNSAGASG